MSVYGGHFFSSGEATGAQHILTRSCILLTQDGKVVHLADHKDMERDHQAKAQSSSRKEDDYITGMSQVKMKARVLEVSGDVGKDGK